MNDMQQNKQRILIVDDERINRKVLTDLLQEDYQVIIAKSGSQALKRLEEDSNIDLILLDVLMPEMSGYAVLEHLKANEKTKDILVIFITALNSLDDEELGLRLGAMDYISKPFRPSIVKTRVENYLQIVHQRKLLEVLADKDGLTEICNRRRFDQLFEQEWHRCQRDSSPLSLIMLDVDCFKLFNDNYGHTRGDHVLKSVAKTLTWNLRRPADLVARYGGEEFVVLLPNTDTAGGLQQANCILNAIKMLAIPHDYSLASGCISVSMGGVTLHNQIELPQQLIELADAALYKAKKHGRNRVVWQA